MQSGQEYPSGLKIRLTALFSKRFKMVRAFSVIRSDLSAILNMMDENPRPKFQMPEEVKVREKLFDIYRLEKFIVHDLIHPMLKYREPGDFSGFESSRPETVPGLRELWNMLADMQEDINLVIRLEYHKLNKLEKVEHPVLGRMNAVQWLIYAMYFEKSIVQSLKLSINRKN